MSRIVGAEKERVQLGDAEFDRLEEDDEEYGFLYDGKDNRDDDLFRRPRTGTGRNVIIKLASVCCMSTSATKA